MRLNFSLHQLMLERYQTDSEKLDYLIKCSDNHIRRAKTLKPQYLILECLMVLWKWI